ncbi:c-type cytochrome [Pontibacter sp. BAB1700]|uniref:c-type cytochrome n=1 Tax=Pontibacter sp. BAB1700 TaxID=1144253 RepID=UPI00026BC0F7|nr:c-type cytochrome [Pontibacter sp. BAB1700]EJF11483.1 cytochrome C class I [Pontibacter sp. BAB1700]
MNLNQENEVVGFLLKISNVVGLSAVAVILMLGIVMFLELTGTKVRLPILTDTSTPSTTQAVPPQPAEAMWQAPSLASLPATPEGDQIRYGRELVAHTAKYLGPEGSVLQIANGMNCQNCHLDAGTKPFGNNYSLVASTYPKFRARSGTEEDQTKRVTDCFERSLNGKAPEPDSKEMRAMVAYINWVGTGVTTNESPKGAGLVEIAFLDRAASSVLGKAIYAQKCQVCHGDNGQGMKSSGNPEYIYPPLWGDDSYNDGAGLYRVSTFARYVKANMPLGATHDSPLLTDEEAWDLAAYVNSMPRPKKDISRDWPDISKKPIDHPFGPYADGFSEAQHKYGPYQLIIEARKK